MDDPVLAVAQVMVFVKIMLTVVLLDPRSIDTFTLPKSVAGHAASLIIAALLVWLLIRHGRSFLVWSPAHIGVGALLVAFALATPFALDPVLALFGSFKRYLGLTQLLDNALLYLSITLLFRDLRSVRLLAGVSIGVSVPVLAYALVQHLGLDPFTFIQATTVIPISTLGNPDLVGGFMSVEGITALGLAILLPGRIVRISRLALILIGAACVATLYLTGVRAGVLGLAGGIVATLALIAWMPRIGKRRRVGVITVAVLLAVGMLASPLRERLDPRAFASDQAISNRLEIWNAAVTSIAERPLLGLGPDNFAAAYPSHRSESSIITGNLENSTHDLWLYAATSAGIVGVVALLLFVGLVARSGVELMRAGSPVAWALIPFVAYLGQSLVNVNEIVVDWTFWVAAGLIAAASAAPLRRTRRPRPFRAAVPAGVAALAVAVVVATTTVMPRIVAGEELLSAEAYSSAGRGPEAFPFSEAAVAADPRRAEAWSTEGSALFRARDMAAAVQAFEVPARLQPWHPLSWRNLGATWLAMGNIDAAYVSAERAITADQYDGFAHELAAEASYRRQDYSRAAAEGEKAIAYELPPGMSAYFTTISAYVQLKQYDRAEPLSRQAVDRFGSNELRLQHIGILADMGRKADALAEVDALIARFPTLVEAQKLRDALLTP